MALAALRSHCRRDVPGHGPLCDQRYSERVAAGRYRVEDPTHAIVGFSLAVCDKNILPHKIDEAVVNLLGMVGVDRTEAWEVAKRPCPELPGE